MGVDRTPPSTSTSRIHTSLQPLDGATTTFSLASTATNVGAHTTTTSSVITTSTATTTTTTSSITSSQVSCAVQHNLMQNSSRQRAASTSDLPTPTYGKEKQSLPPTSQKPQHNQQTDKNEIHQQSTAQQQPTHSAHQQLQPQQTLHRLAPIFSNEKRKRTSPAKKPAAKQIKTRESWLNPLPSSNRFASLSVDDPCIPEDNVEANESEETGAKIKIPKPPPIF
ncbi:hypothetical protein PSTG_18076, partial [Puccinia striiformis f. sp. tritici PST-78]